MEYETQVLAGGVGGFMAEEGLHVAEVRAALEQVAGVGVAHQVGEYLPRSRS